ncbi:hypothetical protein C8R43DRAFT_1233102 [Mycena crocata]|nr:hypothetical protein C8R43DRAFT_1233099 [Mycena crocata]KAJ7163469.1 hypothetical protein C8R43DRAFT_1233102 [Mycena crocata]
MTLRDTIHPGPTQPVLIVCALHTDILFDMLAAVIEVEVEFDTSGTPQPLILLIQLAILNNIHPGPAVEGLFNVNTVCLPSCPTSDCDTHNIPDIPDIPDALLHVIVLNAAPPRRHTSLHHSWTRQRHKSAERGYSAGGGMQRCPRIFYFIFGVPASEGYVPSSSSVPRPPRCYNIIAMRVGGAQRCAPPRNFVSIFGRPMSKSLTRSKPQVDNPLLDFNNCMSRDLQRVRISVDSSLCNRSIVTDFAGQYPSFLW